MHRGTQVHCRTSSFTLSEIITGCSAPLGPGSSVVIATGYGLDGPVIESRWGRGFPHLSRLALGPPSPWVPGLSRGKERPGRDADPSPLLVPWSWKSRAIPLLSLWALRPVQSLSEVAPLYYFKSIHFTLYYFWIFLRPHKTTKQLTSVFPPFPCHSAAIRHITLYKLSQQLMHLVLVLLYPGHNKKVFARENINSTP